MRYGATREVRGKRRGGPRTVPFENRQILDCYLFHFARKKYNMKLNLNFHDKEKKNNNLSSDRKKENRKWEEHANCLQNALCIQHARPTHEALLRGFRDKG